MRVKIHKDAKFHYICYMGAMRDGQSIHGNAVLSEHPASFQLRTFKQSNRIKNLVIVAWSEITVDIYEIMRIYNPDSTSGLAMVPCDFADYGEQDGAEVFCVDLVDDDGKVVNDEKG